ncbi:porin [Fusobacterium nucleatum]|uniref:major outer membrane protein FomA n=1 Tax=Fusobacterium nucleatum TaxID=851 RepID=UPI00235E3B7A|nr:porin [Fusobacterium nucleatum]WDA45578.1 porin [Fusobacterium nucleatum]
MKKLALVLGSLLVVGSVASAKEVMPAPMPAPEKVVEYVEKPVIVYRDREVTPAWRPNGSVEVELRNWGEVEGHKAKDEYWDGEDYWTQLRTTTKINFTEKQSLKIHTRNKYGLKRANNELAEAERLELTHTYKFGNLGSSKIDTRLETKFRHSGSKKFVEVKPVFDFSEYFFKNDYVKATALELAPFYRYVWGADKEASDKYENIYGLYANAEFDLPWGMTFQAEFDDGIFAYRRINRTDRNIGQDLTAKYGNVELTLTKEFQLYKSAKNDLRLHLEGVYETSYSWSKKDTLSLGYGTIRGNGKGERLGEYTAKFDPAIVYNFKATDYVTLFTRVGAEYKNRSKAADSYSTSNRHGAKHWRWQPYARVGFKAIF